MSEIGHTPGIPFSPDLQNFLQLIKIILLDSGILSYLKQRENLQVLKANLSQA